MSSVFFYQVQKHPFWYSVNGVAFFPLLWLSLASLFGQLGGNPTKTMMMVTGEAALVLLLLSLACTPLNLVFGFRQAMTVRKALGLQAFLYAGLHILIFVWAEYSFRLALFLQQSVLREPSIPIGLAAFLILLPLALTSAKIWQRWLGKKWKQLHRWVYVAAGLAVLHTVLLWADCQIQPLTYGKIFILLLAVRIPALRTSLIALRHQLIGNQPVTLHAVGLTNRRLKPERVSIHSKKLL